MFRSTHGLVEQLVVLQHVANKSTTNRIISVLSR